MADFTWHPFVAALLDALVPEDGPRLPDARFVASLEAIKSIHHDHVEPVGAQLAALMRKFEAKRAYRAAEQMAALLVTAVGVDALRAHINAMKRQGNLVPERVKALMKNAETRSEQAVVDKPSAKSATKLGIGLRKH